MSIVPLPVFEADADPENREALTDAEAYARLTVPETVVVRYGRMKLIGEFRFAADRVPGCGSKLIARTPRGTEVVEMLTTTCENAGCGKSITRKDLLEYIEESGGKEYPFTRNGRVIRIATPEDLSEQTARDAEKPRSVKACKAAIADLGLDMKLVDVEHILGGEQVSFYFTAEERVDFRELVTRLAAELGTRIEMVHVGARDEARLVADYERCGQYCCCKSFLKVLKPVSMGAAKMQKATLDPLKISGRCGRLMCCLRYEDKTYRELKAALPHRKTRVGTSEGPGIVKDTKTLVQLVLVELEADKRQIAVPVEELMDPDACPTPAEIDALRGMDPDAVEERIGRADAPPDRRRARKGRGKGGGRGKGKGGRTEGRRSPEPGDRPAGEGEGDGAGGAKKKRRRRRRGGGGGGGGGGESGPKGQRGGGGGTSEGSGAKKKRRRRRRGRGGGAEGGGGGGGGGD